MAGLQLRARFVPAALLGDASPNQKIPPLALQAPFRHLLGGAAAVYWRCCRGPCTGRSFWRPVLAVAGTAVPALVLQAPPRPCWQ
jgi:hypothetical protein